MILDTSAVLAILNDEPEARAMAERIEAAEVVRLSVAGYLEAAIWIERNADPVRRAMFDTFLNEFSIQIEPITVEQGRIARDAFRLFGKGLHKAGLNFGDCFTYALAKAYGEPVLFKGNDFNQTDLLSPG